MKTDRDLNQAALNQARERRELVATIREELSGPIVSPENIAKARKLLSDLDRDLYLECCDRTEFDN